MPETTTGSVVKYKPIEVVKGDVGRENLDSDGFLNVTRHLEEDEVVGEIYIFRLWDVPDKKHFIQDPFGFTCDMSMELELANGRLNNISASSTMAMRKSNAVAK